MKNLLIYLLCLALVPLFSACTVFNSSKSDLKLDLVEIFNQGKYEKALLLTDSMIKSDPRDYIAWAMKGRTQAMLGLHEEGIQSITQSIEINPLHHHAYAYRGTIYFFLKQPKKAIADMDIALRFRPKDIDWLGTRAGSYFQLGNYEKTIEEFDSILQLDPQNYDVIMFKEMSLRKLGHDQQAFTLLNQAIEIDPKRPSAYAEKAEMLVKMNELEKAVENFNMAIELMQTDNPKESIAFSLNNRGNAKYLLKNYPGALTDINKSLSILPTNSYAFKNRALVYLATDKKELACKDLQKAQELGFQEKYGDEVAEFSVKHCQ